MNDRTRTFTLGLCIATSACGTPAPNPDGAAPDGGTFSDVLSVDAPSSPDVQTLNDAITLTDAAMPDGDSGVVCTPHPVPGTTRVVEAATVVGQLSVEMALTPTGGAMVLYQRSDQRMTVGARWNGRWTEQPLAQRGRSGAIALDANGVPRVVYLSNDGRTLYFARWNGLSWRESILDRGVFGDDNPIVMDATGKAHIAWWNTQTNATVHAVINGDRVESRELIHTGAPSRSLQLAVARDGTVHAAWYEGGLVTVGAPVKHAVRGTSTWTESTIATRDATTIPNGVVRLAVDSHGRPVVYFTTQESATLARWNGTGWSNQALSLRDAVREFTAKMALDECDRVHLVGAIQTMTGSPPPQAVRYLREAATPGTFEVSTLVEGGGGPAASHGMVSSFALGRDGRPRTASVSNAGVLELSDYDPPTPATPVGTRISAATGGTVQSPDGLATLTVAPGALVADTTISVVPRAPGSIPAEISATAPHGVVYQLTPSGTTFSTPATLTLREPAEELWQRVGFDGERFYVARLRSDSGTVEVTPGVASLALNQGIGSFTLQVPHFSDSWIAAGDPTQPWFNRVRVGLPLPHQIPVGRLFSVHIDVTNGGRARSLDPGVTVRTEVELAGDLTVLGGNAEMGLKVREETLPPFAPGERKTVEEQLLCVRLTPGLETIRAGALSRQTVEVACVNKPLCAANDPTYQDLVSLSNDAFGDASACELGWSPTAESLANVRDAFTRHPDATDNFPLQTDEGADDDAHFEAVGGYFVDLDAAAAARLTGAMPCGSSGTDTYTVCPSTPQPFTAGRYFVGTMVMNDDIKMNDTETDYLVNYFVESDGLSTNNWTGATGRAFNFENGSDTWFSYVDNRSSNPSISTRRVTGPSTSIALTSNARITKRGNAFLLVVSGSDVGTTPRFGAYAIRHVNRVGSFDTEPPVTPNRQLFSVPQ